MERAKGTLANTILQGEVEGKSSRGRPVVGQCKGMEKVSLNEMWRVPCGQEKPSVVLPQRTE